MSENVFGKYLKKIRQEKKLGINQLAQYSGVSSSQISRIESGSRGVPKPETIEKLAKALKVEYEELMRKAGYIDSSETKHSKDDLNSKDEKDIAKRMAKIREDLKNADGGLSFHGEPMSEEAMESVLEALEFAERTATKINKKYIPKKFRNDKE